MANSRAGIRTADGHKISNIWVQNRRAELLVLVHGISSEKTEEGAYPKLIAGDLAARFDGIMFDFRGHGNSWIRSDRTTVAGCALDLLTVLAWARDKHYKRVYCVAASFGASIALLTLPSFFGQLVGGVVFWNPVINFRNTFVQATTPWGRTYFNQATNEELVTRSSTKIPNSKFKISALMTQELFLMRPESTAWPKSVPLSIFHGTADTHVPYADSMAFAGSVGAAFRAVDGVDHGFDNKLDEVIGETRSWLMALPNK